MTFGQRAVSLRPRRIAARHYGSGIHPGVEGVMRPRAGFGPGIMDFGR